MAELRRMWKCFNCNSLIETLAYGFDKECPYCNTNPQYKEVTIVFMEDIKLKNFKKKYGQSGLNENCNKSI